jgi:3-oxoacyl-[acyl-carrier-protein] synthase-3
VERAAPAPQRLFGSRIAGCGHYAPERRVANREIEARLGLAEGWIEQRTGIRARRYAAPQEATSDLAVAAAEDLFARNPAARRADIGLLLLATSTPDHLLPPCAPLVAQRLGLAGPGAMDLAGACAGFVQALVLADGYVRAHGRPALVVAANVLSRRLDPDDRPSAVLFADAAGAVLLEPTLDPGCGVLGAHLGSDGSLYHLVAIAAGGSRKPFADASIDETLMRIADGRTLFHHAVELMVSCAEHALATAGIAAQDITRFVPHQANARMTTIVARRLGIRPEAMLSSVDEFGNSSAATIPLTLSLATRHAPLRNGECLLFTAAGAGLTGGAAVIKH